MRALGKVLFAVVAATAVSFGCAFADEGKLTFGTDGNVSVEAGGVKVESGEDGTSLEAGGVKVSDGRAGSSIEAGGVKISDEKDGSSVERGRKVGGRHGGEVSAGGEHWNAGAQGGATGEAGWSVGADDKGNVGAKGGAKVGADGSVTVGVSGKVGDDQNNVHGSGEITLSAEVVAEIAGQFTVGQDGTVVAKAEAKVGASVSADGTIKGGVTVWGVPVDVVLAGGVSAGAEAGASAGATFDANTGKLKLTLEASAVLGVGAHGNISVEIGIVQLAQAIGTGIGNAVGAVGDAIDEGLEKIGDTIGDLWDWINDKIGDDPGGDEHPGFETPPENGDSNQGGGNRYQGLNALKLID